MSYSYKILFTFFVAICLSLTTYCQKKVTVIFKYKQDSTMRDSFMFNLAKPLLKNTFEKTYTYTYRIVSFKKNDQWSQTTCLFDVPEATSAFIQDGFNHEVLIKPGDVVTMTIAPGTSNTGNPLFIAPWLHDITYSGPDSAAYHLFDLMASKYGALHFGGDAGLSRKDTSLILFCNKVEEKYENRKEFLSNYAKTNKINPELVRLARTEIDASYINNLMTALNGKRFDIDSYPPLFKKQLLSLKYDDWYNYTHTYQYSLTVYNSFKLLKNQNLPRFDISNENLIAIYRLIKQQRNNKLINSLLTQHLNMFITSSDTILRSTDSLFNDFKSLNPEVKYTDYINNALIKKKQKEAQKLSVNDMLKARIVDRNGKSADIKSLMGNKPVVIICWASWCVPCIKELPAERILQEKYGKDVDFVYLSFDANTTEWKSKTTELSMTGSNFLLSRSFRSDYAKYHKINSIPRYFMFDTKQNEIQTGELRPSDGPEFDKLVQKLIK